MAGQAKHVSRARESFGSLPFALDDFQVRALDALARNSSVCRCAHGVGGGDRHTPLDVDLVCLSAAVSNAEELAAWVTSVRGHTEAIIHEKRHIELMHLYLVGNPRHGNT